MDEGAVLEWLIENRSTGDEDDVIEDVDIKSLETMIQSVEQLAVLFCKLNIDIKFKFSLSRFLNVYDQIFFIQLGLFSYFR